jgi:hypothetical protein
VRPVKGTPLIKIRISQNVLKNGDFKGFLSVLSKIARTVRSQISGKLELRENVTLPSDLRVGHQPAAV